MSRLNYMGVSQLPSYSTADKERKVIGYRILILMGILGMTNNEQAKKLSNIVSNTNGVTALICQLFISTFVIYPWVSTCLFIGKYSKRHFLVVRHMAPLFSGAIIMQLILTPILCGEMDSFGYLTRYIRGVFNHDSKQWKLCTEEAEEAVEKGKDNCSINNPFIHVALCYTRSKNEVNNSESITEEWYYLIPGILISYVLTGWGFYVFRAAMVVAASYNTFCYLIGMIFIFFRVSVIDYLTEIVFIKEYSHIDFAASEFITWLQWKFSNLAINSPLFIMLGCNLTVDRKCYSTATHISIIEAYYTFFLFFAYVANLTIIASTLKVPMSCIFTEDYHESYIAARKAATFIIYEDQGEGAILLLDLGNAILYKCVQLLRMTVHINSIYYTILDEFKSIKNNKLLQQIILIIITVTVHVIGHLCVIKFISGLFPLRIFAETVSTLCALTFSVAVFLIYGTSELNKDNMFLFSEPITPIMQFLVTLLPFQIFCSFIQQIHKIIIETPTSGDFEIYYYGIVVIPLGVVIITVTSSMLSAHIRENIDEAFLPSSKWMPWSPPGYDLSYQRIHFSPETAVKFEGDYYRCNHNCWLNNDVIAAEIIECNKKHDEFAAELREVNLKTLVPHIYKEYEHVLKVFQTQFQDSETSKKKD